MIGNTNARGSLSTRSLDDKERAARLKADRMLNEMLPECVAYLRSVLRSDDATRFDKQAVCNAVLDRKIPKITSAEIALRQMAPVILRIEGGLGWPEMPEPIAERIVAKLPNGNGKNGHGGDGA